MSDRWLGEVRAEGDGRRLVGLAVPYGERAADRPEVVARGAFREGLDRPSIVLRAAHDRGMVAPVARVGAGMQLRETDRGVELEADLPPGVTAADDLLSLIRAGVLTALSVEFASLRERRDGDLRIIERARLLGIAVVPAGAYAGAGVEARETRPPRRRRMVL